MMNVFVIGPDGCGKTEISHGLSKKLSIPRFKVTTEKENWENDSFAKSLAFDALLPQFIQQTDASFVSDRGYPCEWVYSKVFGRKTDDDLIWRIDEQWSKLKAKHVICRKLDYSKNRPDELVSNDFLKDLDAAYVEFGLRTKCEAIVINVDDFRFSDPRDSAFYGSEYDLDRQVSRIVDLMTAMELRRASPDLFRAVVDVARAVHINDELKKEKKKEP